MKVKANYAINCDKGYFETGDVFEIDEKDLPTYGDAVKAVYNAPEAKAEPAKNEPAQADEKAPVKETENTESGAEKTESETPRTTRSRTRSRK